MSVHAISEKHANKWMEKQPNQKFRKVNILANSTTQISLPENMEEI